MTSLLLRDVPEEVLSPLRKAAAARGISMQSLLQEGLRSQARHLERRLALAAAADHLKGQPPLTDEDRMRIFDEMKTSLDEPQP
ncbi:MAG: FitA-like ribbon-helix-helix domain-containing protein [Angustibacter sp.]